MGLNRTMKVGETLYLQRGEEVIAFHIHEFTQGERAKRFGELIKVNVIIDAPKSWEISHHTKEGIPMKGKKPNAYNNWSNQEKEQFAIKAIKGHSEDTRAERSEGCLP